MAYALLILGMLAANFGIVLGLTIEYGLIKREFIAATTVRRTAVIIFILLAFSAIWLAGSAALIHLAQALRSTVENWVIAFCLACFGTFVLVPLKRVLPGIGSGLGVSVAFNAVVYLGFAIQGSSQRMQPWGLLPIILFELALWRLLKAVEFNRAVLLASLVVGVFFAEVYYPFTASLFPWSFSLQLQLLSPLVGSVAGAYLGNRVFSALSSVVLSEVTAVL
jgi:hypothetical protein